jgi:hypothetical protein
MFTVRAAALAFAILSPAQGEWIAWQTQDPVKVAEAYMAELLPAFKNLDVVTLERLYTTDCIFGSSALSQIHGLSISAQKDTLMMGIKSVGLDHESKAFREKVAAMKIMSAVTVQAEDWESDVTGSSHGIRVIAWMKVEVDGEEPLYQWVVLVPFEGAENGWTCNTALLSPAPASTSADLLEQPVKAARVSPSIAGFSSAGAEKIVETYLAELLPAFKNEELEKLDDLYSPECVFGNPDAGEPSQQKEVLMKGIKSVGLEDASKAFRDEVKSMKVMSAVFGQGDSRILAMVKVEVESCENKKTCKDGSAFYQWVVLVPKGHWDAKTDSVWIKDGCGWTSSTVLMSPAPVAATAELMELPASDAGAPAAAVPASSGRAALVGAFAGGVLLATCFFRRKELGIARLSGPSGLQEPLLIA